MTAFLQGPVALVYFNVLTHIGQFFLVAGITFVAVVLIISYLRFQNMTHQVILPEDIGDTPENALLLQMAHRIGTTHRAPDPFCVLLAAPCDIPAHYTHSTDAILEQMETRVRQLVRRVDSVVRNKDQTLGIVVEAKRAHIESVAARIIDDLRRFPCRCTPALVLKASVRIGIASFPENGQRAQALRDQAWAALNLAQGEPKRDWVLQPVERTGAEPDAQKTEEPSPPPPSSSLVDELTGVLRPERITGAFHKYVARYRRESRPVSLLYLDIDYFRRYNEHHGREAGDEVLRGLGALLQKIVREEDLIGRHTDDEFVLAMACTPAEALTAAQRLAAVIKRTPFVFGSTSLKISVSIGIAGYPDHGTNVRHLFENAQSALYAAKQKGSNLCLVYDASMNRAPVHRHPVDVF